MFCGVGRSRLRLSVPSSRLAIPGAHALHYSGGTRPALGERTPIAQKNGRYEVPKQALETSNPVNSLKIKAYNCTSLGF